MRWPRRVLVEPGLQRGELHGPCVCAPPTDAGSGENACIPGQSIACAGAGGCSGSQICNGEGSGYGTCDCPSSSSDASTLACIPATVDVRAGPGGCISSQLCNESGSGYGACICASEGGAPLLCVPGQSIACGGPYGCASFQVCEESGSAYGPCDCPEGGTASYYDGSVPDGYAPLPPPVGDQGYNAIWVISSALYPLTQAIILPLYSAPDCKCRAAVWRVCSGVRASRRRTLRHSQRVR